MARRELTAKQEQALARAAEQRTSGSGDWDFAAAKPVNRGRGTTVVLSGRVPAVYAQMLRRIAVARGCSISDLVKQAVENYAVAPAPQVSYKGPRLMMLDRIAAPGSETMQEKTKRFIDQPTSTESRATA